jgi:transcriptional regulator with XRE-family HTH domain
VEAGVLLRRLEAGEKLGLPHSRSMPSIGARCHELRIPDARATQVAVAKRLGSSQSRVAKMEAGDRSVSIDLLMKALVTLGATPSDVGKALQHRI